MTTSKLQNSREIIIITFLINFITLFISLAFLDPFNIPKFCLLLLLGITSIRIIILKFRKPRRWDLVIVAFVILILGIFVVNLLKDVNRWSALIGVYGRNTGVLTYLSTLAIFFGTSLIRVSDYRMILLYLSPPALVMALYGLIQYSGSDPFKWNNSSSPIIGTFGNPNFMSAYLGWAIVLLSAIMWLGRITLGWKLTFLASIAVSFYLIIKSNSIQGIFVASIGIGILTIVGSWHFRLTRYVFLPLYIICMVLGALATLNKGPLTQFIYQTSISARGDYFRAAVRMASDNPIFGVGIDKFGIYFPIYRDIQQIQGRNWATYTDNAHNLILHLAATSGWLVAVCWLGIHFSVWIKAILCLVKEQKEYSRKITLSLLILSISAFAPSIISVDHITSAVLNWFLLGLLYSRVREVEYVKEIPGLKTNNLIANIVTIAFPILFFWKILFPIYEAESTFVDYSKKISKESASFEEAKTFDKILNAVGREYRYLILIGNRYARSGDFVKARETFYEILNNYPKSGEVYRQIALTYEGENDLVNAVEVRRQARLYDKYNMANLLQLVDDLMQLGIRNEAEKYYLEMKNYLPNYPYTQEAFNILHGIQE